MSANQVMSEIEDLPIEAQREVADFVRFLRSRYTRSRKPTSLKSSKEFIGMWKRRNDLKDSSAVVRRMRDDEWNR